VTAKKGATFAAPAQPDREDWMTGVGRMAQAQTAIMVRRLMAAKCAAGLLDTNQRAS
jgi:hypothetical protein